MSFNVVPHTKPAPDAAEGDPDHTLIDRLSQSSQTPIDLCRYMREMSTEMAHLARACGHGFLGHLFDMASTEADRQLAAQEEVMARLADELSDAAPGEAPAVDAQRG